jgi:ATP-dependent helicase/DNAse subunit B
MPKILPWNTTMKGSMAVSVKINGYDLPVHVSYSSLTTYLDCGWKYYLSRIVKIEERPTWYLVGGSAVHEATEAYDKETWNE